MAIPAIHCCLDATGAEIGARQPGRYFFTNSGTEYAASSTLHCSALRCRRLHRRPGPAHHLAAYYREWQFRRKDGSVFTAEVIATAMPDGNLLGMIRDITERKKSEELLRESEEQFRTMANSIPQLAWMAHADGFIFWYNQRWHDYTGMTPEQMEGWGWQSVHDPDLLPVVLERWREAIATGQSFDMEFPLRGADGRFRMFLTRIQPLKDSQGGVVRWFGTNTDIEEAKLNEEALRQSEARFRQLNGSLEQRVADRTVQLQAANKELEAFSYSVSHDLRAPLRHINGFSQALLEDYADLLDETGKAHLQEVRAASKEMAQLIDDLLQLARVTRSEMRNETVNLSEIAHTVVAELQSRDSARRSTIEIAEGLVTRGDKRLLQIMLTNLLENAWKYTSKCEAAEIAFGQAIVDGEAVYFVRDNGAGFEQAYVHKLFGAFQRLHSSREFEGTGIGLATVQRIVHRHGGRVWAEGKINQGAVFQFTLGAFAGEGSAKT